MLISLTTLLATLSSIFHSRAALELENLALRHQIGVLQRSARKRPKLTSGDRLLWICLSRLWRDWRSALAIVKPETVVAWHRAGFRLFWTWKVRRGQPGRPLIARKVRELIRKMCRENPGWGCTAHPRRTAQTRHRHRGKQRQQIHGALPQTAVSDLAHISGESRQAARSR
jgi:putative transposase